MYSEAELEAAVAEGAVAPEAAAALRAFVARRRAAPAVDEEHFRLLTGFNDIFVTIAAVLLLTALGWLGMRAGMAAAGAAVAAASWGLAEFFTRRRRMALPSILLLVSFVGGVAGAAAALGHDVLTESAPGVVAEVAAVLAAGLHWMRFHVPVTVAVGACAGVTAVALLLRAAVPGLAGQGRLLLFLGGLAVFALAMRWDISDRTRTTRRADVAFWLHLAAAPMIVHPAFGMLGLLGGVGSLDASDGAGLMRAGLAVALYLALALVALVVDRRALLVSALFYVVYAITALLRTTGGVATSLALTGLVVGLALLLLAAFWHTARRAVVGWMPGWVRETVPVL